MNPFVRVKEPHVDVDWARLEKLEPGHLATLGLEGSGLRNLELVDVPEEIATFIADLLIRLADRAIVDKPQHDGVALGGSLIDDAQPAIHISTLRVVSATLEPGGGERFRVVDYEQPAGSRFPERMAATHLALLATGLHDPGEREWLYRRSVELFSGKPAPNSGELEFQRGENLGNYLGWEGLGEVLLLRGKWNEGHEALQNAIDRCPAWALDFAAHVRDQAEKNPALKSDPAIRFWLERDLFSS